MALCTAAVAIGAWLLVVPFILKYKAETKLDEVEALSSTVSQIQNLEHIRAQISECTGLWQNVQSECAVTVAAAKKISEEMAAEAKEFAEFMKKASDTEKATLRLEADKLRRMEGEYVQVLVRMLDHVYALYLAGMQSGQQNLIQQLGNFQNACRDATRRVGLNPFTPQAGEAYDAQSQQLADAKMPAGEGTKVAQCVAPGYTFQSRIVRPALVITQVETPTAPPDTDPAPAAENPQGSLGI